MKVYEFTKAINVPKDLHEPNQWHKTITGKFLELEEFYVGRYALVTKRGVLKKYCPTLAKYYPPNTGLKIYWFSVHDNLNEMTAIKRLAWLEKIAPKIYGLVKVRINGDIYTAQVMELLDGEHPPSEEADMLWDQYINLLKKYHVKSSPIDSNSANFVGNKLVDFDSFKFKPPGKYEREMLERYKQAAWWGSESSLYQHIPQLGLEGSRTMDRYKKLGILDIDLTGKTMLDIGCSGGQMLIWAAERGAVRVVGVDLPHIAKATFELTNFYHYFNIETVGADLTQDIKKVVYEQTGIRKFDVVTMFSMNHHIGFHQYMKDLCKGTLYLETNAAEMPEVEKKSYPRELGKLGYKEFKYKGQVDESGGRSLFVCQ